MSQNCTSSEDLRTYQHLLYAVVYGVILAPGLLGNVLALCVFRVYVKETKKAVVFMMNLAVADLLQVLSLPLRIYYYLNNSWPFGHPLCMICFYLKYVNMYASIFFLVCVSVRRCELIVRPLNYNSSRSKWDMLVCAVVWCVVCLACLLFPLLRTPNIQQKNSVNNEPYKNSHDLFCFAELPTRSIGPATAWAIVLSAELVGFVIPLAVIITCTCLTAWSLRHPSSKVIPDRGEKRKALRMVLSCSGVFLVCFVPYHITLPLDFVVKSNSLKDCALINAILRWHPITLCLASLNCCLDPLMYYFMTDEFRRRLSKPDVSDGRRLSHATGEYMRTGNTTAETS
ncbi:unnamed protein product [Knipowitschia caucasica]|uniref:G-protein coupled receptors family 1 profile domain-containing protein n=1 Tax=Knipowitschia caucasica TaxID=637954 RepID=A0AAV2ML71_KNICA